MKREGKDCFTQAIAYIIGIPHTRVPLFIRKKNFVKYAQEWLGKRGYTISYRLYKGHMPRGTHILQGQSPNSRAKNPLHPRTYHHSAVFKNGKYVFDSLGKTKPFKGDPIYIWTISKK